MSKTPLTDAQCFTVDGLDTQTDAVAADFARELERRVADLEETNAILNAENERWHKYGLPEWEKAEQDAAKYRWLRKNMTWYDCKTQDRPILHEVSNRIFYHATDFEVESIDDAIDKAMSSGPVDQSER